MLPAAPLLRLQLNPVLFVAVVAYVVVVLPLVNWHEGSTPAETVIAVGVPTVGVTVTVLVTIADGPLQPLAVTCILTVPENPLVQVIIPVVAPITPAAPLLRLQLKPVLVVAVVAYVVVVLPLINWHEGSTPAKIVIAVGVPTVGVTEIFVVPVVAVPHEPLVTAQ
jgi:hypothetical protein